VVELQSIQSSNQESKRFNIEIKTAHPLLKCHFLMNRKARNASASARFKLIAELWNEIPFTAAAVDENRRVGARIDLL
jgi:hypothetical protein